MKLQVMTIGRDFICVQSLDGSLSFFEQETPTFSRVLPDHLLPGPFTYCSTTDSFVVGSSSRSIDCYRYQIIAIAKDSKNTKDSSSAGKRIVADWSLVLGETVIDLQVVAREKRSDFILAMGERNLFVAGEDGSLFFVTKFDFCPVSLMAYMNGETLMTIIVTEFCTLLCFAFRSLKWAARMSFPAIALRRAHVSDVAGVIVALSESGELAACYLGTNPSIALLSVVGEKQQLNYEEAEKELTELRKTIRSFGEDAAGGPMASVRASKSPLLQILVTEVGDSMHLDTRQEVSSIAYKITLKSESRLHDVRLTIDVPFPLRSHDRCFSIEEIVPNDPIFKSVVVFSDGKALPPSLHMNTTAVFFTEMDAPRICSMNHALNMKLISKLSTLPSDDSDSFTIPLNVVSSSPLRLHDVYPEFLTASDYINEMVIETIINSDLTAVSLTSKATQCKIAIRSRSMHCLTLVSSNLIRKIRSLGLRFDAALFERKCLPVAYFFELIDKHLALQQEKQVMTNKLSEHAAHFRSVEKRFLVRLKDRNPAPTSDIENLISFVVSKV